jgi:hypothetical protein
MKGTACRETKPVGPLIDRRAAPAMMAEPDSSSPEIVCQDAIDGPKPAKVRLHLRSLVSHVMSRR